MATGTNETSFDSNFYLSFHFGFTRKIYLKEKSYLTYELLYSRKGYSYEGLDGSTPMIDGMLHYNYLSVPILVNCQLAEKVFLGFGPELSYLLSARLENGRNNNLTNVIDINRFDLGLGTALTAHLTPQGSVSFRYFHGFSNVLDPVRINPTIQSNEDAKFVNRALQLSFSYYFDRN